MHVAIVLLHELAHGQASDLFGDLRNLVFLLYQEVLKSMAKPLLKLARPMLDFKIEILNEMLLGLCRELLFPCFTGCRLHRDYWRGHRKEVESGSCNGW